MEKKPVAAKTLFLISINAGKKLYPKKKKRKWSLDQTY
jgi:hypothetical protein